jgi:hypothetical protein
MEVNKMKRVLTGLSVVALVAMLALFVGSAQPAAASVDTLTNKVAIAGGEPGGIISVWLAAGGPAADSAGQPIGTMESATRIDASGMTEVFVPLGMASNVFLWSPTRGYTLLGTVVPATSGAPITLAAK